jgi:hypothetical protein
MIFLKFIFGSLITENRPRSPYRSLLLMVIVLTISFGISWKMTKFQVFPIGSGHTAVSMELAINRILCGKLSHFVQEAKHVEPIRNIVINNLDPEMYNKSILLLYEQTAGSKEDYCKMVNSPYIHNENSLMFLNIATLYIFPNLTFKELNYIFFLIQVVCFAVFVFFLLYIGVSPMLSLLISLFGLTIIRFMNLHFYLAIYPFLMPLTLFLIALFGFALIFSLHQRGWKGITLVGIIGIFGGFFANLRTSYYPIILACFLCYAIFIFLDLLQKRKKNLTHCFLLVMITFLSFLIGMAGFHFTLVRTLNGIGGDHDLNYHHIAHPLVLGLAIPENDLSRREGIKWDDLNGLEIANRIDKDIQFMNKKYEKTLLTYYFALWSNYPAEMVNIYWNKLKMAGVTLQWIKNITVNYPNLKSASLLLSITMFPILLIPNGLFFLVLFLVITIAGFTIDRYINNGTAFTLSTLAILGLLLLLESAIINPQFHIQRNSCLLFLMGSFMLIIYQVVANFIFSKIYNKINS